jgi:biotin carboxyl carrier protein
MKLAVTIDGHETSIEFLAPAPACRYRFGDSPEREAHVESPAPGLYSVLLEGRSYDAYVEPSPAGVTVSIEGYRFDVEVRDPRRLSRRGGGGASGGVQTLSSPMPGKVVRLLAAAGDAVAAGQGILVIEAMKMQNELKAAHAGTVLTISAKAGDTVTAGAPLATIG